MGILQAPTQLAGTPGIRPNFKYMTTTDNYATITTAGYLNQPTLEVTPVGQGDVIQCLYSVTMPQGTSTYGVFTVSIAAGTGIITLVPWGGDSGVVLPTIANHIATYTNTTGTIGEDAATAINGGNIQAGLSGTAGNLVAYPGTASKGQLIVSATANTGNTSTVITNVAMGQNSIIQIPDPGTATADFAVAPAALVSGNLIEASGTAGLIADAGISAVSVATALKTQTAIVTMTAAQVNAAYATPFLIVAAPATGFALMPIAAQIITVVSTAFTAGGVAQLQWGNTIHAGGTVALDTTTPTAEITAAASQIYTQYGVVTTTATPIATANGLGLYFTNATQGFATGTGSTVTIAVTYMTVPV